MLQGLDVDPDPETLGLQHLEIPTVYEDNDLLVIDKPSGILSVPGRIEDYSGETVMRERYPDSIVAHRLDMGTSGLLIVAKNGEAYRILQQQFIHHEVKKKYLALLEQPGQGTGVISLPLRPDPMNRPRQVVDMTHGKRAVTRYEYISDRLVALWPETGRTHQLRIHCAHPDGLANPIVGDELYGTRDKRLCLHAAEIWFRHPVTGSEMHFETTPNFI
jgi:tRNA pseudouridine32 synthase/23S rRNA pseudouridine746 synthase